MPVRTIIVNRRLRGRTLQEVLRSELQLSPAQVHELIKRRRVKSGGEACLSANERVRPGQRVQVALPDKKPGARATTAQGEGEGKRPARKSGEPSKKLAAAGTVWPIRVLHIDQHIIVVDKPAGLTTVRHAAEAKEMGRRAAKYLPPTLVDLLPAYLPPHVRGHRIRAVHRLDKDTSGVLMLARTAEAERALGLSFRAHDVERRYVALVRGRAQDGRIESDIVRDRGDGRRGSASPDAGVATGEHAITNVRVRERLGDFTMVECRLETGRTHQVRIHLGERGWPLCGERIYDRPLHGKPLPDDSGAARPMLHAATLALAHPATGERLQWEAPLPADMEQLLNRLRKGQRQPRR